VIAQVSLSNWIIMCTVLIAMFIGFNKRRYDIEFSKAQQEVLSKYEVYFIDRIISVIASTTIMAYALYVMAPETVARFQTNNLIYTVPFVLYGIFRYLYLIDTKWFGGDPARILIGDYKMVLTGILWILSCIVIIYFI